MFRGFSGLAPHREQFNDCTTSSYYCFTTASLSISIPVLCADYQLHRVIGPPEAEAVLVDQFGPDDTHLHQFSVFQVKNPPFTFVESMGRGGIVQILQQPQADKERLTPGSKSFRDWISGRISMPSEIRMHLLSPDSMGGCT